MAKLTDYELVAACNYQASMASGSETSSDELTASRTNALKYYLGKPRGDEADGSSNVISMDIADTVHAMLAQMMPTFRNDTVVQFEAESADDEEQVRTEGDFCNYMVMEKNNGYILLQTAIKDALLSKNCVAKVYVDEKEDVQREKYKGLTEMEIFQALQPTEENQIVEATKFEEKEGILNLKRVTTRRQLKIEAVAPENFMVSTDLRSPMIQDTTYCSERFWRTRSDLIEEGFDAKLVYDLPSATTDTKVDSIERNQIQDEQNFHNNQPEAQVVELTEHYIRIDYDGDGIAELRKVLSCQSHLLETEEVPCIPYATGVAILMGHRFYGLSIYDLLRYVQDGKTMLWRQWLDNTFANNHNTTDVIESQVNMEDFLNARVAAVRRVDDLNSSRNNPVNDIGPSIKLALDYQDKVRAERAGSAVDLQTNEIKTPHNVGDAGVNTLVSNLEQISALITSNIAETFITQLYLLTHKFLKMYFPQNMSAKISGNWAETNPESWKDRDQVNVSVGLTKTERLVRQVALEKIITKQEQLIQGGFNGVLADITGYHRAVLDHARMSGIDHPEKYWIDPNSQEAQQAGQQSQQQQEQQKAEQDNLQNQLIQTQIMEIQRNYQNDKEEMEYKYNELKFKYDELDQKGDIEEAKIIGNATLKLEEKNLDAESNRESSKENQGGGEQAA